MIYGTTEPATVEAIALRFAELGLTEKSDRDESWDVFTAGQVLAVVKDKGKPPTYIAAFKRASAVGRTLQKLCRPMKVEG